MAIGSSSPAADPHTTTAATSTTTATATATATNRPFTNQAAAASSRDPRAPTPALSQPPHHPITYPSSQSLFTAQPLPNLTARVPNPPQLSKPHDPPQGILYPVASSGRGFIPKALRPQSTDQTVTVANPGGFPPRSVVAFSHQVRPFGFPHSDSQGQPVHLMRPPHVQHSHLGSAGGPGAIKGIPVSAHTKVAPFPSSVSDCNGYKDSRDRRRDDTFVTVRDRKVRISDGASLYALCRSWLKNGFPEESQPQHGDGVKSLPRPLPVPAVDAHLPKKNEGEEEEEDEGSVEHLPTNDLLQRHIKRAKRVRARLREHRLQRIARYKTRLALLLPPIVEQYRNDTAAGN